MKWTEVNEGQLVRFTTSRFCKVGVVKRRVKRSLLVRFHGETKDTALPDGRLYWNRWRRGIVEDSLAPVKSMDGSPSLESPEHLPEIITVQEASLLFSSPEKLIRRWIRSGQVPAVKRDGQWRVDAISLGRHLSERS